ncbi:MAG: DNA gyrase/topoisomerase IV subunit A, partial [Bacteroidales bacterium]|nr:DNA gyrase/topoisomerase IV subunit A [Bacteroidales bacterium]
IDDNTAAEVEILIHLNPNVSPDKTMDALYAFTNCEVSISPNACVIKEGKPSFIGVSDILRHNTNRTLHLLKKELDIKKAELLEQILFSSLVKIFIEHKIYRKIEKCTTWEAVLEAIDEGLEPFKPSFYREITEEDLVKLTEIRIKRISKYDAMKADEVMKGFEDELQQVAYHLDHLIPYAIDYFQHILEKYGKGRERKTEIRNFDTIEAVRVVAANAKLYVNRNEGFAGTLLKKDEFVCDCSDMDDIIVFRGDGTFKVVKIAEKVYVGDNIIHIDIFRKNDDRTIYNMVYSDGKGGSNRVKRFAVLGVTRDKEYNLTREKPGSKVLYMSANPNGEAEVIKVFLRPKPRLKIQSFEFDFSDLAIKGRNSAGNILTKHAIRKISIKEEGISTLGAMELWFDDTVNRLNVEERGKYIDAFSSDDKIVTIQQSGICKIYGYDLSTHFEDDLKYIFKFNAETIYTLVYYNGEKDAYYLKRFTLDVSDNDTNLIGEDENSKLIHFIAHENPRLALVHQTSDDSRIAPYDEMILASEFIDSKSAKAKGKRLTKHTLDNILILEPWGGDQPDSEHESMEYQDKTEIPMEPPLQSATISIEPPRKNTEGKEGKSNKTNQAENTIQKEEEKEEEVKFTITNEEEINFTEEDTTEKKEDSDGQMLLF